MDEVARYPDDGQGERNDADDYATESGGSWEAEARNDRLME